MISTDDALRDFVLRPPGPREVAAFDDPEPTDVGGREAPILRVIGPGRFERGYLTRLSGLSAELEMARECERRQLDDLRTGKAALEVSQRVERGCQRRIDRLEDRVEERTQALLESERQHKRLILALGVLQGENAVLRSKLEREIGRGSARAPALGSGAATEKNSGARSPLWRRIFSAGR